MSKNLEITGTYLNEKFRFSNPDGDTIIAEIWCNSDINDTITIKGQADLDELQADQEYRFYGRWTTYKNRRTGDEERQFHFSSFVRQQPHSREAVISYLRQAGEGLGFGTVRAAKLWSEFGSDAVRVMREEPERAAEFLNSHKLKLSFESAKQISEALKHEQALEGCILDLADLLTGRGFPKATSRAAVKLWGNKAAQTIRRNPYLMMKRLAGCGFKRCDALYLDLGKPATALKRQALCGWYAVASDSSGDTWFPADVSLKGIVSQVGGTDVEPERAVRLATRARWLAEARTQGIHGPISAAGDRRWVAEFVKAEHEQQLAIAISQAMVDDCLPSWPGTAWLEGIDEHQRSELTKATAGPIGILGGSPGTGKTYTAAALVKQLVETIGADQIAIGAPTGKAAVRVTENLARYGLDLRARTWHSHLAALDSQERSFFPEKILIGDECFAIGTLVDTPGGPIAIETLRPGDQINNAIGTDTIVATKRTEIHSAVRINAGQADLFCSENHPFFTARGVVFASELRPGDSILRTEASMRLLREDCASEKQEFSTCAFLRHVLLNEMVDAVPGVSDQSVYQRAKQEKRRRPTKVFAVRHNRSRTPEASRRKIEANAEFGNKETGQRVAAQYESSSSHSRREWTADANSASKVACGTREGMASGISGGDWAQGQRIPDMLQDRYRQSCNEDCNRSRWFQSRIVESGRTGPQEGPVIDFVRVDRVTVYESTSPELDRFMDADGKLYFYDIQAARHQSFSIGGLLVHNCSMMDTDLMAGIFRRRSVGTHVLLVGDVNQLPPVGHGAPLRDMIAAGLPYGELREIKRNSGGIVEACAAIRDRRPWTAGDNLAVIEAWTPDDQIRQMIAEIRRQIAAGRNGIWDVQIVCAVNDKSPLGRKALNKLLQAELNPNGGQQGGGPFRVGDKAVNTKNGLFQSIEYDADDPDIQANDRGEVYVANGELAEVIEVHDKLVIARLSNPERIIKIPMGKADQGEEQPDGDGANSDKTSTGCSWDLGYALSVHKSQGSEWPVVIVMLDEYPGARMVCSREWLYTGLSRAKDRCVLIGKKSLADFFCRRPALDNRKTLLKERILLEGANRELAEM